MRAVAKGVRKTTSKFGARLEPLSHVRLLLYRGRELDIVSQAESVEPMAPLLSSLDRASQGMAVLEAADQLALEREPNPQLYRMLVGVLRTIAERPAPLVVPAFYWKLLAAEGLRPELDACVRCGGSEPDVALVAFDLAEGGVLCRVVPLRHGAQPGGAGAAAGHPRRPAQRGAGRPRVAGHPRGRRPRHPRPRAPHRASPPGHRHVRTPLTSAGSDAPRSRSSGTQVSDENLGPDGPAVAWSTMPATELDQIVNLCKRRGFVYPSAEIYGGFRSAYDYGPLGALMLRNVKDAWVRAMVQERDDVVLIDAAILGPPQVWEASGHLANFTDPLVDCTNCKNRFRLDKLDDPDTCPSCGKHGTFTEARQFNLMFKTQAGPVEDSAAVAYLRPETAQGMFVNFANVLQTTRKKPPFGIAQVGKSFRNEITPQNWIFRTREFEQMEMEFFVPPADSERWYEYWCNERLDWYVRHGIPAELLRLRPHDADELSHYSSGTSDVEFLFPWGFDELEGIAQRTDFDLKAHAEHSGERLDYFDQATGERYVPYVIEPAAGATRTMAAFLLAAYDEDVVNDEPRTVLRLHPRLAPYQVAVLPLSRKDTLTPLAHEIRRTLSQRYMVDYDETQAIGRRYRRQDEIGTPLAVTVDFESLDDKAVTIRDRDTTEQVRVPIDDLVGEVGDRLGF